MNIRFNANSVVFHVERKLQFCLTTCFVQNEWLEYFNK